MRCCSALSFELSKSLSYSSKAPIKTCHSGKHFRHPVAFEQSNPAFSAPRNCCFSLPTDCKALVSEANSPGQDLHFSLALGEKEGG